MKKTLQILNGVALVATIFINYLSNTGAVNGKTIGEVSAGLQTLFTPAAYAFSIWGFIYLLLIGFAFYQGRSLFTSNTTSDDVVLKIGWWFIISCIANSAWVFLWIYGATGASCVVILILLWSLMQIVFRCNLKLEPHSFTKSLLTSTPFIVYAGWVSVASVVNISTYLVKINWDGFGIPSATWAIIMIVVAMLINILAVYKRNLWEFALVGAWALLAIGVRNNQTSENVSIMAYIGAIVLLLYCIYHAYSRHQQQNSENKE
ncbi:tryptophan-rich sensory protein [Flavobacterium sp.]|uniref:tryptophan-rich sensory protein n=1 Tax=Flavobacterium sp. TaxID=239 RepID=UPI00262EB8F1|nr:tryptophan-rich sensory protein [Flavobacterium sp.]MDD3004763.1 tryptophan-rich sensory protein [Flavobacterium sp.]